MRIEIDDLSRPQVHALLNEHLTNMYELSPPENVFALDLTKLRAADITFWTVWENEVLLGCGALRELSATHGEVKSMRTPKALRRRGAGRAVLAHIIEVAIHRGYEALSLETGSNPAFLPAQKLYQKFGFAFCGPFGSYRADPNSVFMSLRLAAGGLPAATGEIDRSPRQTKSRAGPNALLLSLSAVYMMYSPSPVATTKRPFGECDRV
jgi:putative acetyltransferase